MTKKNLIVKKGVSLREAREYVNGKKDFQTHTRSLYGVMFWTANRMEVEWQMTQGLNEQGYKPLVYAVFSYGMHFPMYVYDYETDKWFGNSDKFSKTTTKHMWYAKPTEEIHAYYDTRTLSTIVEIGYIQTLTKRLEGEMNGTGQQPELSGVTSS